MKLSDYVVKFIEKQTDSIFLLSGGGIMHLVNSVGNSKLHSYCCHHEQAAAIAAEGYSRVNVDSIGVCLVTTGPGGTNAITGLAGAWLDSVPLMIIAGQVKRPDITSTLNGQPTVRQTGFQELNVIDLVKPITKYAITVDNQNDIRYHLEKALFLAKSGRPGPVFVEIPLDVQAEEIDPGILKSFDPVELDEKKPEPDFAMMAEAVRLLQEAKKPLLMAGNGIRLAGGEEFLRVFLEKSKINTVTPMFAADDLVTDDYPGYLGPQGMPGSQAANYAVDNCDVLLIVGERMSLTQTSYDHQKFATQAKIIMVDIDEAEMRKKTIKPDLAIVCDAKYFLEKLLTYDLKLNSWNIEAKEIAPQDYQPAVGFLNVYAFLKELNKYCHNFNITTANGNASLNTHQALRLRRGQRFLTNAGLGHMGSGLPLAIGAAAAANSRPVICMEGDGSLMLNIHELQTVLNYQLPIKLFIFNNDGYCSIRNTHKKFFGKIFAADRTCGVALPDYAKLIPAWGLRYERLSADDDLSKIKDILKNNDSVVCELMLDPNQPLMGRWTAGQYRE